MGGRLAEDVACVVDTVAKDFTCFDGIHTDILVSVDHDGRTRRTLAATEACTDRHISITIECVAVTREARDCIRRAVISTCSSIADFDFYHIWGEEGKTKHRKEYTEEWENAKSFRYFPSALRRHSRSYVWS